ncbi:CDP-diacylglycerol--serine O-phosphatidyltransferase [Fulvivirga imtechensis AK7]|uniref:CDP-diacylglycerol--serine O-phosphatidyltransferase n=1 Tax=Fulvivirga imtechensis AK7 TaxID=1237149 RepID=L8JVR2_9BACT|nr:CDP-diacylglycerol--serine O-phosphatidyltransferase [Fulvivirga imtechensis]ELR72258.1 CDP-diacylglycerol--serine O-phosphatidyltransferase [Fulvivirga imtechensis AK7]
MNIKKHIPNSITCGNLLCGCIGIVATFKGELIFATYLLWLAIVLDFFDGFVARLLKVSSPIGKELDSLADMVTFGVLPSVIMYHLITDYTDNAYLPYIGFVIAIFSALRLAKFNIDDRQTSVFIGLPTPANALFISSLVFIAGSDYSSIINLTSLVIVSIGFSLLLVSPIELFALKFKSFKWTDNKLRFTFLLLSVLLLGLFQVLAIPMIIIGYIVLSVINNMISQ